MNGSDLTSIGGMKRRGMARWCEQAHPHVADAATVRHENTPFFSRVGRAKKPRKKSRLRRREHAQQLHAEAHESRACRRRSSAAARRVGGPQTRARARPGRRRGFARRAAASLARARSRRLAARAARTRRRGGRGGARRTAAGELSARDHVAPLGCTRLAVAPKPTVRCGTTGSTPPIGIAARRFEHPRDLDAERRAARVQARCSSSASRRPAANEHGSSRKTRVRSSGIAYRNDGRQRVAREQRCRTPRAAARRPPSASAEVPSDQSISSSAFRSNGCGLHVGTAAVRHRCSWRHRARRDVRRRRARSASS